MSWMCIELNFLWVWVCRRPCVRSFTKKSMFWLFMNEVRWKTGVAPHLYHQMCIIKNPSQNIFPFGKKTAIFWCIFLFDRKIKVRLKDQAEKEVGHIKNGEKRKKEKRNERCGKFHYLELESFAKLLQWDHESDSQACSRLYSYLAFSLIEAIVWPGLKIRQ